MVAGEGIEFGAVYRPLGEIVPVLALPPATPPTNQVTLLFDVPVTVAWNCCDWLRGTLICAGCKTTVTTDGPFEVTPAQLGIATAAIQKSRARADSADDSIDQTWWQPDSKSFSATAV